MIIKPFFISERSYEKNPYYRFYSFRHNRNLVILEKNLNFVQNNYYSSKEQKIFKLY